MTKTIITSTSATAWTKRRLTEYPIEGVHQMLDFWATLEEALDQLDALSLAPYVEEASDHDYENAEHLATTLRLELDSLAAAYLELHETVWQAGGLIDKLGISKASS